MTAAHGCNKSFNGFSVCVQRIRKAWLDAASLRQQLEGSECIGLAGKEGYTARVLCSLEADSRSASSISFASG